MRFPYVTSLPQLPMWSSIFIKEQRNKPEDLGTERNINLSLEDMGALHLEC